jgi:hypothetical protein
MMDSGKNLLFQKDNNVKTDLMQRIKEERKALAVDEVPDLKVVCKNYISL